MLPVMLTRMAVRAGLRDYAAARADWEEALRRVARDRDVNGGWIEDLVVAAEVYDALGEAELRDHTVRRAEALAADWDTLSSRGQVAHLKGRLAGGDAELLRGAVDLLAVSPARLLHARALVDLGSSLRRAGHRVDSREPLREGYEMALACGAAALAERARAELRSSGIRVRRDQPGGADALTPSERRIAEMAASGLSNPEIAQELFLTIKTIEMHLTRAYRKLDIRRRGELAAALSAQV
jgi:DNA-binding CsgD family transcriptional regulator